MGASGDQVGLLRAEVVGRADFVRLVYRRDGGRVVEGKSVEGKSVEGKSVEGKSGGGGSGEGEVDGGLSGEGKVGGRPPLTVSGEGGVDGGLSGGGEPFLTVSGQLVREGIPAEIAAELVGLGERPVGRVVGLEGVAAGRSEMRAGLEGGTAVSEPIEPPPPIWRAVGPVVTVDDAATHRRPEWLDQGPSLERLGSKREPSRQFVPVKPPRPLVPPARLGCVLRQRLAQLRPGVGLDEPRLVFDLARGRLLTQLPRQLRKTWPRRVQLYWDLARATAFCWHDQKRVDRWLGRWLGELVVETQFTDGFGPARRLRRGRWVAVTPPDPHTVLLALSDLGAANHDTERCRYWAQLAANALRRGATCEALVLCPRSRWSQSLAPGWGTIDAARAKPFKRGAPKKTKPTTQQTANDPSSSQHHLAERLITLLAPTLGIEPGLLRAARDLLRGEGATFETELAVWLDARLVAHSRDGAALKPEARHELHTKYLELPEPLRREFEAELKKRHQNLSPLVLAEELIACSVDPSAPLGQGDPPLEAAREILAQYARRLHRQGLSSSSEAKYGERMAGRQARHHWSDDTLAAVWAYSHLDAERRLFTQPLPEGLTLDRIAYALDPTTDIGWVRVWQQGAALRVEPIADRPTGRPKVSGSLLGDLPLSHRQLMVKWSGRPSELLTLEDCHRIRIPRGTTPGTELRLETDRGTMRVRAEAGPSWAKALWRDREGLWVRAPIVEFEWVEERLEALASFEARLDWLGEDKKSYDSTEGDDALRSELDELLRRGAVPIELVVREHRVRWPEWAERLDWDEYGLVATLRLGRGVTTRFRWIPAGRFLMGSPESEAERDDSERQHWVTLTRGFWLGEAACTQAEWSVVIGENPSYFKGEPDSAQHPVEQVSWEDCVEFLERVNQAHPGMRLRLPTEAEWEYACRAGTDAPFSFGANITTEQVNYDGNYPYAGAAAREYREKTVPVRSLPPNSWGLHEMHGNVLEWCGDWFDHYAAEEQRDPVGPSVGRYRVLRGGSWSSGARNCRSALRSWYSPDLRWSLLGFRLLAVQPGEPAAGAESSGGGPGEESNSGRTGAAEPAGEVAVRRSRSRRRQR